MKGLGVHALVELNECDAQLLDDPKLLESSLLNSAKLAGATILSSHFHQFSPQGVSGVVIIEESHFSVHTWPEFGYAAIDFFTCSDKMDFKVAYDFLVNALESKKPSYETYDRGLETNAVVP